MSFFPATKTTSAIAGVLAGLTGHLVDRKIVPFWVMGIVFYCGFLFLIVGVPMIVETHKEIRRRKTIFLLERGDLQKYYFPAWLRMFIWFLSAAATGIVLNQW